MIKNMKSLKEESRNLIVYIQMSKQFSNGTRCVWALYNKRCIQKASCELQKMDANCLAFGNFYLILQFMFNQEYMFPSSHKQLTTMQKELIMPGTVAKQKTMVGIALKV